MDAATLNEHKAQNRIHSILLVVGMVVLLSLMGRIMLGRIGLFAAIAFCVLVAIFGTRVSPRLILRMYRAQPLHPQQAPELHRLFDAIVARSELKVSPQLYYVPTRLLNAFAVGTEGNSAVAVTDGILRVMNGRELAGILAHEVSHIMHRDTKVMGLADVISRVIATISQFGQLLFLISLGAIVAGQSVWWLVLGLPLLIFAPYVSNLLQLALSRKREFLADLGAAQLTGDPHGLASALTKLDRTQGRSIWKWLIPGRQSPEPALLRTHPPTHERIKRLVALKPQQPIDVEPAPRRIVPPTYRRVRRRPRYHLFGLWH